MDLDDWDELGPPEIRAVPQGHPRLRIAAIAGVVAGGLLLVALGVWAVARPSAPETPAPRPPAATPAGSTNVTESFVVTASADATPAAVQTWTPSSEPSGGYAASGFERAAKVAYRRDGALWVADESGSGARKVLDSASGAFALSPDGGTLAVVDGAAKSLSVVDVATQKVTAVGPAEVRPPVWSASSTWLAYTSAGTVRRVGRAGTKARDLGAGQHVAIGPDGVSYAFTAGAEVTVVGKDGGRKSFRAKGRVDDLALGPDRLYYALGGTSPGSIALHKVGLDGAGDTKLAGAPADSEAGRYDELTLSPDGTWLAYAAAGDDMHSRIRAIRTDGTGDTRLSLRHDDYLLRWSSDATRVFFIDGNVLQGDATQLMSIRPDGTQRATILKGAGM